MKTQKRFGSKLLFGTSDVREVYSLPEQVLVEHIMQPRG